MVMRDGALFVVVPSHLAQRIRDSRLREDLEPLLEGLPVHYRVQH